MAKDSTFNRVLKAVNSTSGPTQAEREEARRRKEQGERQSKEQRERENRVAKLRDKPGR